LEHSPEQLSRTNEVLLADEFLERPRPHSRRQRLGFFQIGVMDIAKEVNGERSLINE
jgi:hypothetical protein